MVCVQNLSVYGDDYPTPDGTAVRDYIHVVDLAKAHVIALQRLLNKKNLAKVETFNLGTGTGSSVLEVINSFEKVSGQKLPYKIVGRREGDVTSAYANTDKANDVLGWKAQSTFRRSDGKCLEMGTESKSLIKKRQSTKTAFFY